MPTRKTNFLDSITDAFESLLAQGNFDPPASEVAEELYKDAPFDPLDEHVAMIEETLPAVKKRLEGRKHACVLVTDYYYVSLRRCLPTLAEWTEDAETQRQVRRALCLGSGRKPRGIRFWQTDDPVAAASLHIRHKQVVGSANALVTRMGNATKQGVLSGEAAEHILPAESNLPAES